MYTNSSIKANGMGAEIKAATYEPLSPDEHIRGVSLLLSLQERSGFVFLIAYAKKEKADSELLLQVLMDHTRRLADTFGKEANPQHRFEQFLGALNETLANHVREGRWHIPIEQLQAMVGIATLQNMYLSGTGELVALFLHKRGPQRYQVFNLFRGLQTEQALPTWEKTFAVVLDGDLHPGDVFCISDKDLQRAIQTDELNHILASLPPVSAVEKIRQYFPHKDGMLLTLIKIMEDTLVHDPHTARTLPQSSLSVEQLNTTQDVTERLLDDQRPNIIGAIKKILAFIQSKTDSRSRILKDLESQGTVKDIAKRLGRMLWKILSLVIKMILKRIVKWVVMLQNKEERARLRKRLHIRQKHVRGGIRSAIEHWQGLPRSTKFLTEGILIAVVILVIGISAISKSQARSAEEAAYQEQVATIEDTMERAGAAVIYQDENQARSLYLNAQTLIETLPTNTRERQEKTQQLLQNLQIALNDIRHLITIPNPPLLADLETISDGVFGNGLVWTSEAVFVAASDGRLYSFNRGEKRFDVVATPTTDTPSPIAASQEEGRIYILSDEGGVFGVSLDEKTIAPLALSDDRWVDTEAYANRLYLLRPTFNGVEGQIIRLNRSGSSFTDEAEWITSRTVSLDQAISIAIDGDVYILMRDGAIVRFTNGSEAGWDNGVVDPMITDAKKLWTDPESAYLYVLEPSTQRLIVFEKETGEFVAQYRSDAFSDLTDFAVDENGYTIYLLAGSKLYSIAASHLE